MSLDNSLVYDPSEFTTAETKTIIGRTIVDLHIATDEELFMEQWTGERSRPIVVVLDDGTKLYAAGMDEKPGEMLMLIPEDAQGGARVWHKARLGIME